MEISAKVISYFMQTGYVGKESFVDTVSCDIQYEGRKIRAIDIGAKLQPEHKRLLHNGIDVTVHGILTENRQSYGTLMNGIGADDPVLDIHRIE
jgi:hypothetical protein